MTNKKIGLILNDSSSTSRKTNNEELKVCEIAGTRIDIKLDLMANAIIIDLADEQDVLAKEVIQHLESTALAARTRKRLGDIAQRVTEIGTLLILHLQGTWESWIEFDIRDAIAGLLAKRSVAIA